MTLSSNTAQSRDMTELRNHLKWLDEERRKTARKITELEQRLAQQGREIADREQRIQELEWQLGQTVERLDRVPEADASSTGHEQRLQDLEWHLSNINAQLVRMPKLEEDMNRLREERTSSLSDLENRFQAAQNQLTASAESQSAGNAAALQELERAIQERLAMQAAQNDEAMRAMEASVAALVTTSTAKNSEAVNALERDMADLAARMVAMPAVEEAVAGLQSRVNTIPIFDLNAYDAQLFALRDRLDAIPDYDAQLIVLRDRLDAMPDIDLKLAAVREEIESAVPAQIDAALVELRARLATNEEALGGMAHSAEVSVALEDLRARLAANEAALGNLADSTEVAAALEDLSARLNAIPNFDAKLAAFKEEIDRATAEYESRAVAATADYEARAVAAEQQAQQNLQAFIDSAQFASTYERISRIEESLGGLAAIRESVTQFGRLEQELELRQAEEVRLGNLIGLQEEKLLPLIAMAGIMKDNIQELQAQVTQSDQAVQEVRAGVQNLGDTIKPRLDEARSQIGPISDRLSVLQGSVPRLESTLDTLMQDQARLRDMVESLNDHVKLSQSDVTRQIEGWQAIQDEQKDTVERFTQQWLTLSNQYKEARMAVQNFAHWQKQLEQQKREASELVRMESNRLQSRWEGFLLEVQEKLKNSELDLGQKWQAFEMDNEQRWTAVRRTEQQWRDELAAIDELILKMQQDNRNLIWRVQAAQADAIKKWPRLLLEEVEKAIELNPQRRLQPTTSLPRSEMSVVDALEQGLIKIDYEDESGKDGN